MKRQTTPMLRRSLMAAAGLALMALAVPLGDLRDLACELLIGWLCGASKFSHPFGLDRIVGWAALVTGWGLISRAIAGADDSTSQAGRLSRLVHRYRWAPLPAAITIGVVLALAHAPGPHTRLIVDVSGAGSAPLKVDALARLERQRQFRFGESLDYLFGLPFGGTDQPKIDAVAEPHAEFSAKSPQFSFERWQTDWNDLTVEREEASGSLVVSLSLVPCDGCGETTIKVDPSSVTPCTSSLRENVRCVGQTARYPRGAEEIRVRVELDGGGRLPPPAMPPSR